MAGFNKQIMQMQADTRQRLSVKALVVDPWADTPTRCQVWGLFRVYKQPALENLPRPIGLEFRASKLQGEITHYSPAARFRNTGYSRARFLPQNKAYIQCMYKQVQQQKLSTARSLEVGPPISDLCTTVHMYSRCTERTRHPSPIPSAFIHPCAQCLAQPRSLYLVHLYLYRYLVVPGH